MAKNRFIVFLAAAALAFAAHAEEVLKGVVTFSGDEFLVVAPEDRPHWRGTLVRLLKEDGTRAMGPERFTPGERITVQGQWVDKTNPLKFEFAAAMVMRRPGFVDLPEATIQKSSDWRSGNLSLNRVRLEGRIVSLEEEVQDDGRSRTYIVLSQNRKHKAACVHGRVQAPEIREGATIAAIGVVRTVFDEAGTALASELEITGEDGLVLLAAKPADYAMEVAIAVAALLAVAVVVLLTVWLRSRRKRHMLEAIARDRKRIAGDLHDTIEQHLATAKILLSGALRRKNISDEIADAIKAAAGVLVNAKVEVRDAVMDLRGESTTFATLADELKAAAKRMTASGTVNVRTSLNALPADLAVSVRRDIAAIVREAMTNAIKHGKAKRIVLVADSLGKWEGRACRDREEREGRACRDREELGVGSGFVLRILNDGEKFDAAAALGPEAGHFGLFGMKERALRSGLSLSFVSDDKWCGVKIVRS